MNSPEVQVHDGSDDAFLWPSEEIRQRAIDTLMKHVEKKAEELFKTVADKTLKELEERSAKLHQEIEKLSQKVDQAELPNLNALQYDKLPYLVQQNIDAMREMGKICWIINDAFSRADNESNNMGSYDQNKKVILLRGLVDNDLFNKLYKFKEKLWNVTSRLGINSDY